MLVLPASQPGVPLTAHRLGERQMEMYPLPVAEFARIRVFATEADPNSGEFLTFRTSA